MLEGRRNEAARQDGLTSGCKVIEFAMRERGASPFIADELSLADLYLAPIALYLSLTPGEDRLFDVPGFAQWWNDIQVLPCFKATQSNLS